MSDVEVEVVPLLLDKALEFEVEYVKTINERKDDVIELARRIKKCINRYVKRRGKVPLVVILETMVDLCAEVWARFLIDVREDFDELTSREVDVVLQKLLRLKIIHDIELLDRERSSKEVGWVR